MIKKFVSISLGAGMILATVTPTFAVSNCSNMTTGPSSTNICKRLLNRFQSLSLNNFGTVNHAVNSTANTGNNASDNNTTGNNTVMTGNAGADVASLADLNSVNGTVNQTSNDTVNGTNNTTGPNSTNRVTFNTTNNVTLNVTNNGTVRHNVDSTANTGNNTASHNTVGGGVTSGNATLNVSVGTALNSLWFSIWQ